MAERYAGWFDDKSDSIAASVATATIIQAAALFGGLWFTGLQLRDNRITANEAVDAR